MLKRISLFYIYFIIFLNIISLNGQLEEPELPLIKKCVCKANETQSREGCVEIENLRVQVWNESAADADIYLISELPNVIQPLQCPPDSVVESLYGWVFFSYDGELLHLGNKYEHYCIENVVNEAGLVSQRSEKCITKSSLNICCKIDEYMDSSSRCTKIPIADMKTTAENWLNNFHYNVQNIICKDEKLHDRFQFETSISELQNLLNNDVHQSNCIGMYGDENELYPGITYCYSNESITPEVLYAQVSLCCENGQAYNVLLKKCIDYLEPYKYPNNFEWPSSGYLTSLSEMTCSAVAPIDTNNKIMHHFLPNGSVYTISGRIIHKEEYCLGIIINDENVQHSGLVCLKDDMTEEICLWRWDIYRACIGISSVFLAVTLLVYIGVSELRRRIGGVCLISELLALLVSQITLIVLQIRQRDFSEKGCITAGIVELVFVLASFFWLNIMCYDVWTTFRVLRPYSEKLFKIKLFIKYSLYGWGIPLLIGIVAFVLQMAEVDMELNPNFTPETSCFFRSHDWISQWFYMYGIILILLLINLFFFIHLALTMMKSHAENKKRLRKSGGNLSECDENIENFKLHGKLFIIMGLPWTIEVFTSFASQELKCYIWFLDLINMLRGVLIFIIFVCKKSTRDKLIGAWCPSLKPQFDSSQSIRKTSTSTLSLTSWLPSVRGRKVSKVSMTSGGHVNLEALKEVPEEEPKTFNEGGQARSPKVNDVN